MTRLELTCETCGSHIADPPTAPHDRPVLVCCKASLAKAKARRSVEPVIPPETPALASARSVPLHKLRAAREREFGRLKHDYGLAPLRCRGLARVQLHADLTILARMGQALSRARDLRLAA